MRTHRAGPHRSTLHRRLAVVATLALALAACGDEDAPDTVPEDVEDADAEDEEADAEATVAIGSTDLGEVLVDGEGMTLYMFDPDEQGESTCYDECADAWPPLIDEEPVAGEGVDEALLGTAERDDGSVQVTYDDWPVYLWATDQEPGEATGQGVEDAWWVLDADGTPLRDAEDDTTEGADDEGADDDGGAGY